MRQSINRSNILKFIIPSSIGVFLFLFPFSYQGNITIPFAILSGWLQDVLYGIIPELMLLIITLTFLGTIITKIWYPSRITNAPFFNNLFNVAPMWVLLRVIAVIFAYVTYFQWGPEFLWSENTGGLLLSDDGLLSTLFAVFFWAGLLLPLFLNFGLLEFVGALLINVMRPLFKLPGRAAIDALASWLGDGTIGILLSSRQYEEGFYTKKEAAIVATTFSIVSITFSLVVISTVGLADMFVPFYLTITFSGLVAALIMPRIPPLSTKPNTYYNGNEADDKEIIPEGYTPVQWGFAQAVKAADKNKSVKAFLRRE